MDNTPNHVEVAKYMFNPIKEKQCWSLRCGSLLPSPSPSPPILSGFRKVKLAGTNGFTLLDSRKRTQWLLQPSKWGRDCESTEKGDSKKSWMSSCLQTQTQTPLPRKCLELHQQILTCSEKNLFEKEATIFRASNPAFCRTLYSSNQLT